MKKELFDKVRLGTGAYEQTLTYFMLTGSVSEEYCDLKVYGAEIDREIKYANGRCERDKKIIPDLFFVKSEAEAFLEKIVCEKVTPVDLRYAVQGYIGEQLQAKNVESV